MQTARHHGRDYCLNLVPVVSTCCSILCSRVLYEVGIPLYPWTVAKVSHCGKCHTCNKPLQRISSAAEWCSNCQKERTYPSHGYRYSSGDADDLSPCPPLERNCGRCHTCASPLITEDGKKDWCIVCKMQQKYASHGWAPENTDPTIQRRMEPSFLSPCLTEKSLKAAWEIMGVPLEKRPYTSCGRCHECANFLEERDDVEWCPYCDQPRFYHSHSWTPDILVSSPEDLSPCLTKEDVERLQKETEPPDGPMEAYE